MSGAWANAMNHNVMFGSFLFAMRIFLHFTYNKQNMVEDGADIMTCGK